MRAPSATDMLNAWEWGRSQTPVARGLTLLRLACAAQPPEALAMLSLGERDRRLLMLREAVFGDSMASVIFCSHCGQALELELSARELRLPSPPEAPPPLVLIHSNMEIGLRLPNSRDLEAAATAGNVEQAAEALLRKCVVWAKRGIEEAPVEQLPTDLIAAAAELFATADPQADLTLALTCPACATSWDAPFDIVSFLWTELEVWAHRILWEVHTLATAYGWSEREVLSLGPLRRGEYLQRVLA